MCVYRQRPLKTPSMRCGPTAIIRLGCIPPPTSQSVMAGESCRQHPPTVKSVEPKSPAFQLVLDGALDLKEILFAEKGVRDPARVRRFVEGFRHCLGFRSMESDPLVESTQNALRLHCGISVLPSSIGNPAENLCKPHQMTSLPPPGVGTRQ